MPQDRDDGRLIEDEEVRPESTIVKACAYPFRARKDVYRFEGFVAREEHPP
jgi:hypothetical protein